MVHAECDPGVLELKKSAYRAEVNNLNAFAKERFSGIDPSSPEYQETLERVHENSSTAINNILEHQVYIQGCHGDPDSVARLTEVAQQIVTVPEFSGLTYAVAAGALGIGMVYLKWKSRKLGQ